MTAIQIIAGILLILLSAVLTAAVFMTDHDDNRGLFSIGDYQKSGRKDPKAERLSKITIGAAAVIGAILLLCVPLA